MQDAGRIAWTNRSDYVAGMAIQMNIAEAKAKLSELVARAESGEEVVIARDGVPAVALTPASDMRSLVAQRGSRLGFLAHLGPIWEASDAWEPDEAEIEAAMGGPDDPLTNS